MPNPLWLLTDPSGRVWKLPHRDYDRPHSLRECLQAIASLNQTVPPRLLSQEERKFARAWVKELKWAIRVAKKRHQQHHPTASTYTVDGYTLARKEMDGA